MGNLLARLVNEALKSERESIFCVISQLTLYGKLTVINCQLDLAFPFPEQTNPFVKNTFVRELPHRCSENSVNFSKYHLLRCAVRKVITVNFIEQIFLGEAAPNFIAFCESEEFIPMICIFFQKRYC